MDYVHLFKKITNLDKLSQITVHKKGFFTKKYLFYALLVACYAVLLPWMYSTIGEPYQSTLLRNEELKEKAIDEGIVTTLFEKNYFWQKKHFFPNLPSLCW